MQRWYPWTEIAFWTLGLLWLAFLPTGEGHLTLCPVGALGFTWCPGCGLGHAIHELFQGNWQASWHHHPLAAPAVAILLHRMYTLILATKTKPYVRKAKHAAS